MNKLRGAFYIYSQNYASRRKKSWLLIKESMLVFNRHPEFIVPLVFAWLIYAPIILYLKYWFNWDAYTSSQIFLIIFGIVFIFAFVLSFSCSVLLELIQRLESGQKLSVTEAFKSTLTHNLIKILPIVFIWTVVWVILLVIQTLLSKSKKRKSGSFSAENAARTLAGYRKFSFSRLFFKSLEKGIRMMVFLILPAIAWENLSFWKSIKKGIAVFRSNLSVFTAGFVLTGFATIIIFLPPGLLFFLSSGVNISFPEWVWVITIFYIALAWSYSIYLEQMFVAELYLWYYKWEKAAAKARTENKPIPDLNDIPRPSVLDETNDLL